ncbi:tRNA-binding protein [Candidatus Bipolaricaulota bacterium]|nr:tRNA-binding protein [Candidatus Bipolaricaulota bacterium]MCK4599398.1 tRNA-binding protein [Candidatus Bipolaricaulota bacterium]
MENISFDDWKKLQIRVGKILEVQRVPKTDKLYRLQVDIGADDPMQIVTSLVPYYSKEELVHQTIIVLVNLQPACFAGEISEGMLLCAEKDDGSECVLLTVQKDIDVGTLIT